MRRSAVTATRGRGFLTVTFAVVLSMLQACPRAAADSEEPVDLSGSPKMAVDLTQPSVEVRKQGGEVRRVLPSELGESKVGRRGVATGTRGKAALGEAVRAKAGFNPDCVGPAVPACMRGSVDMDKCKCKCPWNFKGDTCETCNAAACKNGGKMDTASCTCKCVEGFHDVDCSKGSKCLNGATEAGGKCKCKNMWSGGTCKICHAVCENGGKLDPKACACQCPANRAQPDCKTCQDPGCVNGGVYKDGVDDKTGKPICGCKCPEDKAWSGLKCDKCHNPGCKNGATFNKVACRCDCPNENWSGTKCEVCDLHCSSGKRRDDKTCTCVDGGNINYNPCVVGCRHGTLDKKKCKCECNPGFKGIFCDECEIEKCFNGGKLQHDDDCSCKCKEPWLGTTCEECPMNCGPHGTVKAGCSGCKCEASKSGKWVGNTCNKCEHPACMNGGTLDHVSCTCKCTQGYSGDTCENCHLTQEWCTHGSKLIADQCKCDCTKGEAAQGDWGGQLCDACVHKGCDNGGEVDKQSCRCKCVPMWMGRYCKACGHAFCNAKPSGTDKTGENAIVDTPKDTNCKWVRGQLGCPGGLN